MVYFRRFETKNQTKRSPRVFFLEFRSPSIRKKAGEGSHRCPGPKLGRGVLYCVVLCERLFLRCKMCAVGKASIPLACRDTVVVYHCSLLHDTTNTAWKLTREWNPNTTLQGARYRTAVCNPFAFAGLGATLPRRLLSNHTALPFVHRIVHSPGVVRACFMNGRVRCGAVR